VRELSDFGSQSGNFVWTAKDRGCTLSVNCSDLFVELRIGHYGSRSSSAIDADC
jgi:hypothetical protein